MQISLYFQGKSCYTKEVFLSLNYRSEALISGLDNLESYPSHHIEQVYLNYNPVVRARKQDDEYYLTYKGSGMMARDESNLPLNEASYYHLREKADGSVISKRRYLIPLYHIAANAGLEGSVIINKVRESEVGVGFDAL